MTQLTQMHMRVAVKEAPTFSWAIEESGMLLPEKYTERATYVTGFDTLVVPMSSGYDDALVRWQYELQVVDLQYNVKTMEDLQDLQAFQRIHKGKGRVFIWRNFIDDSTGAYIAEMSGGGRAREEPTETDVSLGLGDGTTTLYSLFKSYTFGGLTYTRRIFKPIPGTVRASLNDVETTAFTVDNDIGTIDFDVAPTGAETIKVGFKFYLPGRFRANEIITSLDHPGIGAGRQIVVEEVRLPE